MSSSGAFADTSFHLGNKDSFHLHPLVVFSILDNYKRRSEGLNRVVGTLMGERRGNRTLIRDCFPVPFKEDETESVRRAGCICVVRVCSVVEVCSVYTR